MATPDPERPHLASQPDLGASEPTQDAADAAPAPPPEPVPEQQPASSPEPRLLRRALEGRMIAGVCAGVGRYVGVDPVLIRLAFVILTLAGGSGILAYLILALVMPEERPGEPVTGPATTRVASVRRVVGWGLLVTGAILLVGRFLPGLEQIVWPVVLLAIGAAVLAQGSR